MSKKNEAMLKILLVDDEEDIRDILEMTFETYGVFDLVHAHTGQDAIEKLKSDNFDIIVCDYNMPNGNGGQVYKYLIDHDIQTKYVLCSSDFPENHLEFSDSSLFFHHIEKPSICEGVSSCLNKLEQDDVAIAAQKVSYIPVSINLLLKLDFLPVDIYLKFSSDRYLKVLQQNESFDEVDFAKYVRRSVFKLYVDIAQASLIQTKIEKDLLNKLENIKQTSSAKKKVFEISQVYDQLLSLIQEYDMNENIAYSAKGIYQVAYEMIDGSKELEHFLSQILNNPESYMSKHSMLLSIFTKLIVSELGCGNEMINKKLVAASLFHDMGLRKDLNETVYQLKGKHSDEFKNHPQIAAEIIEKIDSIPNQTEEIILEQHEVGPSLGFPKGLNSSRVSFLGLLFSFSHYFVDYLVEFSSVSKATGEMKDIATLNSRYRNFYQALLRIKVVKEGDIA